MASHISINWPVFFFFVVVCCEQWLPESARYDVLTGNQEKALATLKRIATENGAPMPLGKLIAARQVEALSAQHKCSEFSVIQTFFLYDQLLFCNLCILHVSSFNQEDRGKIRDLFSSHFRWTTVLLWFIW